MKFLNHELTAINDLLLNDLPLSGRKSRMRMKLLKIIAAKQVEYHEDHMELLKEHARKDDKGEPILIEKDGKRIFDIVDMKKFQEAFSELAFESVVIEENEENKEMLLSVKTSLNENETVFKGEKAMLHDYLCEKFDEIYKTQ